VYLCLPGNYLIKYAAVTVARAKNTWNPTTAISATSPAESDNIRAQPAATLSTYYIPRTPKSSRRYHNATASAFDAVTVTKTMTVTIVSVVSAQEPANSADGYVTRLAALQDTTHHMNEIAIGLQDIISGQISGMISNTNSNAVHSGRNPDPPATASATNASNPTPPLADMAVLGYPGGTIVFLNNTSPTYILVNYADASVVIWTSPANASDTVANTHVGKLVSKIGAWLPYFEALGILTLVYKVGKFIYDGVQRRRGRGDGALGVRRDAM
jgi:hypothetical protein